MTKSELREKAVAVQEKQANLFKELTDLCRLILPVLKDHNMPALAESLGAKIFEVDILTEEARDLIRSNAATIVEILLAPLQTLRSRCEMCSGTGIIDGPLTESQRAAGMVHRSVRCPACRGAV